VEELFPDRRLEWIEQLAYHSARGELWNAALEYAKEAGYKAASRSAHIQAVVHFRQALAALNHLPQHRATLEQAIDVRFSLRTSLLALAQADEIERELLKAQTVAETLGDQRRLAQTLMFLTNHYSLLARHEKALEAGQRALEIAHAVDDRAARVVASQYLAQTCFYSGNYDEALKHAERAVQALAGVSPQERFGQLVLPSVFARTFIALPLAQLGDFHRAISSAEQAVRIATDIDHPVSVIHASFVLGVVLTTGGRLDDAIAALEPCARLSTKWKIPWWSPLAEATRAYASALQGHAASVVELQEAVERALSMRMISDHFFGACPLAEVLLLAGRTVEAASAASRTLELAQRYKQRGDEAQILRILGDIAASNCTEDVDPAVTRYLDPLAIGQCLGGQPLIAHCHLGLGKLYRRTGKREQALEHLTTATTMYREMGMTYWLEKVNAETRMLA
jgi:tetratricopeptide (TPR) repeat protein